METCELFYREFKFFICSEIALVRGHSHVVIWFSSYSYLQCRRTKCSKTVIVTVKVTVKLTHDVGRVLNVTKHIFVFISQQYILQYNSVHKLQ